MFVFLLLHRNNQDRADAPSYSVRDRNCASWVNTLFKCAGIDKQQREKLGEFVGTDWGEEDLISTEMFEKKQESSKLQFFPDSLYSLNAPQSLVNLTKEDSGFFAEDSEIESTNSSDEFASGNLSEDDGFFAEYSDIESTNSSESLRWEDNDSDYSGEYTRERDWQTIDDLVIDSEPFEDSTFDYEGDDIPIDFEPEP